MSPKPCCSTLLATVHLDTPSNSAIFVQLNPSALSFSSISTGISKHGRPGFSFYFFLSVVDDVARVVGVTALVVM